MPGLDHSAERLVAIGRFLNAQGWSPATSGNYSARLADGRIAITVSGRHKGRLTTDDIMTVDGTGASLDGKLPSAETQLHVALYRLFPHVNAVLHTHSIAGVVLGMVVPAEDRLLLQGYELQKAFPGVVDHETAVSLPLVDNSQDMAGLAAEVDRRLIAEPAAPAYLIRGHGLYGWGRDLDEAERVVEACETLLACELERRKLQRGLES